MPYFVDKHGRFTIFLIEKEEERMGVQRKGGTGGEKGEETLDIK